MSITIICLVEEKLPDTENFAINDEGDVYIVVDINKLHDIVMLARIFAIIDKHEMIAANNCAEKVCILHDDCIKKITIRPEPIVLKRQQQSYPGFAEIRKFTIPAQCRKANIVISKR